jgi:hypothetical protein
MEVYNYKEGVPFGAPQRFDQKGKELDSEQSDSSILSRLETMVRGK